jgi:hypothetical protein
MQNLHPFDMECISFNVSALGGNTLLFDSLNQMGQQGQLVGFLQFSLQNRPQILNMVEGG